MTKEYAYIRVSSQEQNEERQMIAMRELHVPEEIMRKFRISGGC